MSQQFWQCAWATAATTQLNRQLLLDTCEILKQKVFVWNSLNATKACNLQTATEWRCVKQSTGHHCDVCANAGYLWSSGMLHFFYFAMQKGSKMPSILTT